MTERLGIIVTYQLVAKLLTRCNQWEEQQEYFVKKGYKSDDVRRCICRAWNLTLRVPCLRVHALAFAKTALLTNLQLAKPPAASAPLRDAGRQAARGIAEVLLGAYRQQLEPDEVTKLEALRRKIAVGSASHTPARAGAPSAWLRI